MDGAAANGPVKPVGTETANLPPTPAPATNDSRDKDACDYAVGLSEKFLTLAAGGIAFIIGLVFAKEDSASVHLSPCVVRWALVLFGLSVILGWLFLMNVVGSVADGDYRIKNNAKQLLCFLQILTALFGIGLLAYCTFNAIGKESPKRSLCVAHLSRNANG
jgi:TctA family transporter